MNYYYHPNPSSDLVLNGEESAHAIKVLRKKIGDIIHLMDGQGSAYEAKISEANHRSCKFEIISAESHPAPSVRTHIAIAPTKNIDRIEWFVEKSCELGVSHISIIETTRTERAKVNLERLEKKAISAMKQSKSFWKCKIDALIPFKELIKEPISGQKFIAFVQTGQEESLQRLAHPAMDCVVLIGPEGDFTHDEVRAAQNQGYQPVSLGKNILRTETAGVIAAHTINLVNER